MNRDDWTNTPSVMRSAGRLVGGDHALDGVQIFICETGAVFIHVKTEKDYGREPNKSFGGVQRPIFPFA